MVSQNVFLFLSEGATESATDVILRLSNNCSIKSAIAALNTTIRNDIP